MIRVAVAGPVLAVVRVQVLTVSAAVPAGDADIITITKNRPRP